MNYNKFIFYDEQQDHIIQQIDIPNDFVDWVDEQLVGNLYYHVPTISYFQADAPYRYQHPTCIGIDYVGTSIVNEFGMTLLEKMFLQWIACLEGMEQSIYYANLEDISEEEIAKISSEKIEELKEVFFEKEAVLKQLHLCLKCTKLLTLPQAVMYQEGL